MQSLSGKPFTVRRYNDAGEAVEVDFAIHCLFFRSRHRAQMIKQLLATRGRDLVYAHPMDNELGIGFGCDTAWQNRAQRQNDRSRNAWGWALRDFRDGTNREGKTLDQVLVDVEKKDREEAARRRAVRERAAAGSMEGQW